MRRLRTVFDEAYTEASKTQPPLSNAGPASSTLPKSPGLPEMSQPVHNHRPPEVAECYYLSPRQALPDSFTICASSRFSQTAYINSPEAQFRVEEAKNDANIRIYSDADKQSLLMASTDDSAFPLIKITLCWTKKCFNLHHTLRYDPITGQYFAGIFKFKTAQSIGDMPEIFELKPRGRELILLRMRTAEMVAWTDLCESGRRKRPKFSKADLTQAARFGDNFRWMSAVSMLYMTRRALQEDLNPKTLNAPPPQEETQFNEETLQDSGFVNRKFSLETIRSCHSCRSTDTAPSMVAVYNMEGARRSRETIRSMLIISEEGRAVI